MSIEEIFKTMQELVSEQFAKEADELAPRQARLERLGGRSADGDLL